MTTPVATPAVDTPAVDAAADNFAGQQNWEPPVGREPKAEAQDGPSQMTAALDAAASNGHKAPTVEISEQEEALNQTLAIGRKVNAVADDIAAQQFNCAKLIGQVQAFDTINQFTGVALTVLLRQVKESKAYRGMKVPQADGNILTLNTFEDFCGLIGISRSKVDEDIQNLNALGESFMLRSQDMGLGYKELRKLRALPEADRQAVTAAEESDPDVLKDMIEELAVKNAKATEELAEAKANQEAKDKVLATKNKALDAAQTKLAKLENMSPDEQLLQQKERERNGLKSLHACGLELLGSFAKYLALGRNLMDDQEISYHTKDQAMALTSGMCSEVAEQLLEANFDIDFRILTYPLELGEIPLRGDAHSISAEGE